MVDRPEGDPGRSDAGSTTPGSAVDAPRHGGGRTAFLAGGLLTVVGIVAAAVVGVVASDDLAVLVLVVPSLGAILASSGAVRAVSGSGSRWTTVGTLLSGAGVVVAVAGITAQGFGGSFVVPGGLLVALGIAGHLAAVVRAEPADGHDSTGERSPDAPSDPADAEDPGEDPAPELTVEVYERDGWYWRVVDGDGSVLAAATAPLDDEAAARDRVDALARGFQDAGIVVVGTPAHEDADHGSVPAHAVETADTADGSVPAEPGPGTFELYATGGGWRWQLRDDRGGVLAEAGRRYDTVEAAREAIRDLQSAAPGSGTLEYAPAGFEVFRPADEGGWRWRLWYGSRGAEAVSPGTFDDRDGAIAAVQRLRDLDTAPEILDTGDGWTWELGDEDVLAVPPSPFEDEARARAAAGRVTDCLGSAGALVLDPYGFRLFETEDGWAFELRHRDGSVAARAGGYDHTTAAENDLRRFVAVAPDAGVGVRDRETDRVIEEALADAERARAIVEEVSELADRNADTIREAIERAAQRTGSDAPDDATVPGDDGDPTRETAEDPVADDGDSAVPGDVGTENGASDGSNDDPTGGPAGQVPGSSDDGVVGGSDEDPTGGSDEDSTGGSDEDATGGSDGEVTAGRDGKLPGDAAGSTSDPDVGSEDGGVGGDGVDGADAGDADVEDGGSGDADVEDGGSGDADVEDGGSGDADVEDGGSGDADVEDGGSGDADEGDPDPGSPAEDHDPPVAFEVHAVGDGVWGIRVVRGGETVAEGTNHRRRGSALDEIDRIGRVTPRAEAVEVDPAAFVLGTDGEEWSWRIVDADGTVLAVSGDPCRTEEDAVEMVEAVRRSIDGGVELYEDDGWRWRIRHDGGIVAASPRGYGSTEAARDRLERAREVAEAATVATVDGPVGELHPAGEGWGWRLRDGDGTVLLGATGYGSAGAAADDLSLLGERSPDAPVRVVR